VFQAKLRGWRRLAAGLVLVPGLTGLGADALGLLGRASGQDRPSAASRADEARELRRQAREAYLAKKYDVARELSERAEAVESGTGPSSDKADDLPPAQWRQPAKPAPRPTTTDPKLLLDMAKQALSEGNLDKAQDLATQAHAHSQGVRWGLFDDTPASVLKDVHKARGRRDRDASERLLAEARSLVEKTAASPAERAANLNLAEEKAKQAAALHGAYSMWDFGDRPANVIDDVRKARDTERLGARMPVRSESMEMDRPGATPRPKNMSTYGSRTPGLREPREAPAEELTGDGAARKKAAVALMQEGKALEVGSRFVEARQKYIEAARINAPFSTKEDTPELELSRLDVAASKKIKALVDEARSCAERKDKDGAVALLEEAHTLASGMGFDTAPIRDVRIALTAAAPVIRNGRGATDDGPTPIIRSNDRASADEAPMPIIRSGRKPIPEEMPVKTAGAEEPAIKPIPPARPEDPSSIIKPIPPVKSERIGKTDIAPPPLPAVPDVKVQGDASKPPIIVSGPEPSVKPIGDSAKGQELLKNARTELKKGDTEAARKIAIELINGPYGCRDEAIALLKSVETAESASKIDSARRAFENGMDAYHAHNYPQALAIFKQIDGTLLPAPAREKLAEMIKGATVKKQEMEDAKLARTGEKLPTAPKMAPGLPDVPTPAPRSGSDNLIKQQEAMTQVEFQRLRSKALRIESEATARFGKGETDAALMDLQNYIAEVKASTLDPAKQNMLVRPVEARMERLKILKHQTDFLTKEARDRRNFHAEMTQEALYKQKKQEEVAQLMKSAHKLMDEAKYKEAYVELQKAQMMDPDDPSVGATLKIADTLMRQVEFRRNKADQERFNYEHGGPELHDYPRVNSKNPLVFSDDPEVQSRLKSRERYSGGLGVMRSRSEKEKEIERKMSTPISVNFKGTSLDGVIEHLNKMTGINFDLDLRSLKEGNIDPKMPITTSGEIKDVSLKSALDIICRQAGLRHVIESETIRVTTPKGAAGRQTVRAISVGDLVIPAPNYGAHPGLSLTDQLRMAQEHAYNPFRAVNSSSLRTPGNGLPGGASVGSPGLDLPGSPGRLRNTPMDGGASSNTGPSQGTLEKELIRLITTTIKPESWASLGGEGTIEYYPLTLSLVINQSPEVIEEVERLLESLRKLQDLEVSIEVKVVSLNETFYERIGVDFAMGIPTNARPAGGLEAGRQAIGQGVARPTNRDFSGNVVGLQLPNIPTPDLDIPIRATSFGRAIPPFGGFTNTLQEGGVSLGLAFLSECQVQMFLEAAQGDTRSNVMQAPRLTAMNGTSASMTVGDFQFFMTGITPVQVGGQLIFIPNNVPFQVGITQPVPPNVSIQNGLLNFTPTAPQTPGLGLFIQPVVSADRRFVRLNIQQSFVSLISGTIGFPITTVITPVFENGGTGQPTPYTQFLQQPRFSNLETQTVVVVPDGGTVVLGGLKYMTEGRNEFGPPVLSKIPYLNRLFKNVAYGREGRSILIMITPRVIINREEQERQTGVREDDFVGFVGVGGP
jgi:type II secretory pathway component GspD/PulD (secretin)